jgi:hypothetical protein
MSDYRDEMKEVRWTFWRILALVLIAVAVIGATGFIMDSCGLFGRTIVERQVFEHSYQRTEGLKAEIANDEAALVEINARLQNPNLDQDTRHNLEAQATAARIRIVAAKRRLGQ